jgi:RimJ/RimL family protein N-acetyltransferase
MRSIRPEERFAGQTIMLRLVTDADCTATYLSWLEDPEVNRFLETRWHPQSIDSIRAFVRSVNESTHSYLFAIVHGMTQVHVGNIKIGPIHEQHRYADVSYFIGDRSLWGKGLATDAIRTATKIAFERLDVHRAQAGLYASNVGSARALERVGYKLEGRLRGQLRANRGEPAVWEDHVWYGLLASEWHG